MFHIRPLLRPEDLIALNERRAEGDFSNEAEYLGELRSTVADVVARQRDTGIDLVNDGEFGHSMGMKYQLLTDPGELGTNPQRRGRVDDVYALIETPAPTPRGQQTRA